MSYANQPIGALLRGPLLHTPQGYVVLASIVIYAALAVAIAAFDLAVPVVSAGGNALGLCIAWPFVTFLFFVRLGAPSFEASRWQALWLSVAAFMPLIYGAGHAFAAA